MVIVHHVLDEEDPIGVVNAYKDRLAPGSHLFISHFSNAFPEARAMEENLIRAVGRGKLRSEAEITAFFDGFDLLEPGVVPAPLWRLWSGTRVGATSMMASAPSSETREHAPGG